MAGYYDEVLTEIRQMIQEKRYDDAAAVLHRELAMPYIPPETETQLHQLKRDLDYLRTDQKDSKEESTDTLLEMLQGDARKQLAAAAVLADRNLRSEIPAIQQYLRNDPCAEAAALLIEALAEQKVGAEFVLNRDGLEYTFWPDAVTPAAESEGFQTALADLSEWLASQNPSMYEMARQMLIHEVYLYLPLSYEKEEGAWLARQMVARISAMMDDGKTLQELDQRLAQQKQMRS